MGGMPNITRTNLCHTPRHGRQRDPPRPPALPPPTMPSYNTSPLSGNTTYTLGTTSSTSLEVDHPVS